MTLTIKAARAAHPLAGIVLAQLGGGREAVESAIEAGQHGADTGWTGFTWYSDTVPWAKRHRRAIVTAAQAMAQDLGESSAVALIAGFRCIRDAGVSAADVEAVLLGGGTADAQTAVWNALAWFALEEVGRALEAEGDR